MVQIRIEKPVRAFRNKITNGFGAKICLHQRYKATNGFCTPYNYDYIWPIVLLELKYIVTSARNAAAIAREGYGRIEVDSFLLNKEKREDAGGKIRVSGNENPALLNRAPE